MTTKKKRKQRVLDAKGITRQVWHDGEKHTVLPGVDLHVDAGEILAVVGPSGCGKSTLLRILGGLDPDYEGEVRFSGETLTGMADDALAAIRNRNMGFVFQMYNLIGHLTALENVLLPSWFCHERPDDAHARWLLEQMGLASKAGRLPQALSGGERQRVAIARAMYHRPCLILCDEPTGHLDVQTSTEIMAVFTALAKQGVALLVATHDPHLVTATHRTLDLGALTGAGAST